MRPLQQPCTYEADDFEPLFSGDRMDELCGPHWIGRLDESLRDLALLFDTRWLSGSDFEEVIWSELGQRLPRGDVSYTHWGLYSSDEHTSDELYHIFKEHTELVRSLDYPKEDRVFFTVGVGVPPEAAGEVLTGLEAYRPFVGYADISWPNDFATVVHRHVPTPWALAFEYEDDPYHWIHKLSA